mgnify:CR=1 FL=1
MVERAPGPLSRFLVHAFGIAASGVLLVAAFRSARLAGLYEWDGWAFWVPKAEAIYYLGRLDAQFFTLLPGSSYPPLLPVLNADNHPEYEGLYPPEIER